ncbi:MAG: shikimate 5-dehydrogenase [Bdellovibrionales bacterium]|nr:shikimate 5-dehydrogenase [Bdellovibrionales bacterium]
MNRTINQDTQFCTSISAQPGNFGNMFHNFLYEKMGLNFIYKGCAVAPDRLGDAVHGLRALGVRGCGVSMPFKIEVISFLNTLDPVAKRIGAVNTIVNDGGMLTGYNTDYSGVKELLTQKAVSPELSTVVLGGGGAAQAILLALQDAGFRRVTVMTRDPDQGRAAAKKFGFTYAPIGAGNFDFLVNASSIGFKNPQGPLPFTTEQIAKAQVILDIVGNPARTAFIAAAEAAGKKVLTGFEITALQAREQFRLYTGQTPTPELLASAFEYCQRG